MHRSRSKGNPARLVVALSIASLLATFLLYTSLAGGATPTLHPGQLAAHRGVVTLAGVVVGPVRGDAHGSGLRFRLKDFTGPAAVAVVYRGTVPDLFAVKRHVFLQGTLRDGVFVGTPNSLVTKCPSKYQPAKKTS
jgi:cytochrome c-type biogenesis protein CcmE